MTRGENLFLNLLHYGSILGMIIGLYLKNTNLILFFGFLLVAVSIDKTGIVLNKE